MRHIVKLDVSESYAAISPLIDGLTLEHAGSCVYGGIWAEMLEDRKFFYSPNDAESPWTVPSGSVEMLASMAYAGERSPTVWLPGRIAQAGLCLEAGREYVVRLVVAGASLRGSVEVALCWGNASEQRVTAALGHVGENYAPVTVTLTPLGASDNGRLELAGHGKGAMRIGAVSLMPANNVHGMRRDTLEVLRRLNASLYEWPGGVFAGVYDWRDGVGQRDRRPPCLIPASNRVESNDFGFGEFMRFCAEMGAEPFVVVNSSEGKVHLAVDEVRYANGPGNAGPSRLRADAGRKEPYGVTLWGMGKQQHRTLNLASPQLEELTKRHNVLADSLRAASGNIKLVCVGGSKEHWRGAILAGCALSVDMLGDRCRNEGGETLGDLIEHMTEDIRECALAFRDLIQTVPEIAGRDIRLAIDQWSYAFEREPSADKTPVSLTWAHGLAIAAGLHQLIRDSDVIDLAAYAPASDALGAVWASGDGVCMTAAGHVLSLYRNHFGTNAVPVKGDTAPLDVVAAWTEDRSSLTLGVINPLEEDALIELVMKDARGVRPETCWVVAAPGAGAVNVPGKEEKIVLEERTVSFNEGVLTSPPLSASIFRLRVE